MTTTTLRRVYDFLKTVNPQYVFTYGFGNPHSWRGVYCEVAFESMFNVTAASMLEAIEQAVSKTFYGWKGGEYTYCLDDVGHLEAGGAGCYTEDADVEFTTVVNNMMTEFWTGRPEAAVKTSKRSDAVTPADQERAAKLAALLARLTEEEKELLGWGS